MGNAIANYNLEIATNRPLALLVTELVKYPKLRHTIKKFFEDLDDDPFPILDKCFTKISSYSDEFYGITALYKKKNARILLSKVSGHYYLNITATTKALAQTTYENIKKILPPIKKYESNQFPLTFWYNSRQGAIKISKHLEMPALESLRDNYPKPLFDDLREFIARANNEDFSDKGGRLILMTGAPGTGKTFSIRALIREANTCEFHCVADPETFLSDVQYMYSVLFDSTAVTPTPALPSISTPIKVIILEDSGELLVQDAKSSTGQGFSRLLNLTSGLLGQGERILILITTNEPIEKLHEAVSRKGRCLMNLAYDALGVEESNLWLKIMGRILELQSLQY